MQIKIKKLTCTVVRDLNSSVLYCWVLYSFNNGSDSLWQDIFNYKIQNFKDYHYVSRFNNFAEWISHIS